MQARVRLSCSNSFIYTGHHTFQRHASPARAAADGVEWTLVRSSRGDFFQKSSSHGGPLGVLRGTWGKSLLQGTQHDGSCFVHPEEIHRETMGLEGGVYLYYKMTPPSNFGHFWVIFEEWSQILSSTELFRHGFEQSCPVTRRKSWRKRYSSTLRPWCRIKQNWLQEPIKGSWQSRGAQQAEGL